MITERFIDFVQEIFPCINPYTKDRVKQAIRQFYEAEQTCNYFMSQPLEYLAQGDILDSILFRFFDDDGNEYTHRTKGLLISNTCDSHRDDFVVFAPLLPLDSFDNRQAITNNQIFRLLFFPDYTYAGYVVDLSILSAVPRALIDKYISSGEITKVASLNSLGYYLFLCKLTVHLMRPEDTDVQMERAL